MSDVHTPAQRSYNMSRIRGKNTRSELTLRKALWHEGLRYRLAVRLPGRPDLTFRKAKVVVFVDGCFWHGCPKHRIWPKTNAPFWKKKLLGNVARDKAVTQTLRKSGWLVIRFWEHSIKRQLRKCITRVVTAIKHRTNVSAR